MAVYTLLAAEHAGKPDAVKPDRQQVDGQILRRRAEPCARKHRLGELLERPSQYTSRGERQQFAERGYDGSTKPRACPTGQYTWGLVCQMDLRS